MVKVRADLPITDQGQLDLAAWCANLCEQRVHLEISDILNACEWVQANANTSLPTSLELAELVAGLNMDQDSVLAALLYRAFRGDKLTVFDLGQLVGEQAQSIVVAVDHMANTSLLELSNSSLQESEQQDQVENVKRMLVMLIDDVRVGVLKLAERVIALRRAKQGDATRRQRIAIEAQYIFAPLAGRLGIWQLKWELEDLALRYTEPAIYQQVARQLKSKRVEREAQVSHIADQVRALLRGYGIDAQVFGRAKHIYSIWRKMQSKGVDLGRVYDVRAVRVVVDSLAECYAALGVIHNTWSHIPAEFDDYISMPKENGYRSIHTAVITPDESTLEIQIRTRQMHDDAELGVCAHWTYKDPGQADENSSNDDYAQKMDWLRQVMQWHDELAGTQRLSTLLQHRVSHARIFVSTPKGHVLELPAGATMLDFAYRVHTDVGHRCVGAMVDREDVRLQDSLRTGQQVQIRTQGDAQPHRDWLEPSLAFVTTDRAKAKLVHYFRSLEVGTQTEIGQQLLLARLHAVGDATQTNQYTQALVTLHGLDNASALYQLLGAGELSICAALESALHRKEATESLPGMESTSMPRTFGFCVIGDNRDGLLLDITRLISDMGLAMTRADGRVSNPDSQAIISIQMQLSSWSQAISLVCFLEHISGVRSVSRDVS